MFTTDFIYYFKFLSVQFWMLVTAFTMWILAFCCSIGLYQFLAVLAVQKTPASFSLVVLLCVLTSQVETAQSFLLSTIQHF